MADAKNHSPYWRKTLRLSAGLLAVWLVLTVVVGLLGRSMMFRVLGWPFGFWLTAQVSLIVFCAIVWIYALAMDRLDQEHGRQVGD
jgi:putative solute:sodium symporter small subunit